MHHVMSVAPGMRTVAAGEPAPAISNDHGPAHRGWDDRCPTTDVERLGTPGHHDPHDGRFAGERPHSIDIDGSGVIQLPGSAAGCERIRIHRHRDVWTFAGHGRPLGKVEPLAADLAERVGPALCRRSVVRRA